MSNIEKYNNAFIEAFGVSAEQLPELAFQSVAQWDSIGHMQLIAALEEAFDIMMDTEDIMDFSSYQKGKEYMSKYSVQL